MTKEQESPLQLLNIKPKQIIAWDEINSLNSKITQPVTPACGLGLDQLRNKLYEIKDKHIALTNQNYSKDDQICKIKNEIKENEDPLDQLVKDANRLISNMKRLEFEGMEEKTVPSQRQYQYKTERSVTPKRTNQDLKSEVSSVDPI